VKARDIFGLIVRLCGFALIAYGVVFIVFTLAKLVGLPSRTLYSTSEETVAAVIYIVTGIAFLLGAELLTRLAYGRETSKDG